jgi:hypothetical protein
MRIGWAIGLLSGAVFAPACFASRGPLTTAGDAGAEAASDATDAPVCKAPPGGNDLAFDLTCTGGCTLNSAHLDFHLDVGSPGYPGCLEGSGHLQFVSSAPASGGRPLPLQGTDQSTLEIDVAPYGGTSSYPITGNDNLFSLTAMPPCVLGTMTDPMMIVADIPDDVFDAGGTPSCIVKVETDCADGQLHNVTGTLTCTFPNIGDGTECTLSNGIFSFAGCAP